MKIDKHIIEIIVFINLFYFGDHFDLLLCKSKFYVTMSSWTVDIILFNNGREKRHNTEYQLGEECLLHWRAGVLLKGTWTCWTNVLKQTSWLSVMAPGEG